MEIPEARYAAAVLLADKMSLTLNQSLFFNRLPPGTEEGVFLQFCSIRSWTPSGAKECDAVIAGSFASESVMLEKLAPLRELLYLRGGSGLLAWHLREPVKLEFLPGGAVDHWRFQAEVTLAFV